MRGPADACTGGDGRRGGSSARAGLRLERRCITCAPATNDDAVLDIGEGPRRRHSARTTGAASRTPARRRQPSTSWKWSMPLSSAMGKWKTRARPRVVSSSVSPHSPQSLMPWPPTSQPRVGLGADCSACGQRRTAAARRGCGTRAAARARSRHTRRRHAGRPRRRPRRSSGRRARAARAGRVGLGARPRARALQRARARGPRVRSAEAREPDVPDKVILQEVLGRRQSRAQVARVVRRRDVGVDREVERRVARRDRKPPPPAVEKSSRACAASVSCA